VTRSVLWAAVGAVVLVCGCSDAVPTKASKAASFTDGVCASISDWENALVDAANAFTDETTHLTVDGRKARYLFAFDEQVRITEELRTQLESAPANGVDDPDAVRAALSHAIDDVIQNIHDQKADAAANVDFSTFGPKPDRLFAGTEKSLSLLLKPLDEVARASNVAALGGSCGR
jgi:hypothetical protein